jgi:endonuclease-3
MPRGISGKRLKDIYSALFNAYGMQSCTLDYQTPLQLMVATILSAQCTDERVNKITPALFKAYPDAASFAKAKPGDLENLIKSAGFFRAKSSNIIKACQMIEAKHSGKVPSTMEELTALPGIGRKTANVILGDAFEVPDFPVDTHVKRVLNLLGIVDEDDPVKIEMAVIAKIPKKYWTNFSHLLIIHGRRRCVARKPDCPNCELLNYCKYGRKKLRK